MPPPAGINLEEIFSSFLIKVLNFEGHVCYFEFVNQLSGSQQLTVNINPTERNLYAH